MIFTKLSYHPRNRIPTLNKTRWDPLPVQNSICRVKKPTLVTFFFKAIYRSPITSLISPIGAHLEAVQHLYRSWESTLAVLKTNFKIELFHVGDTHGYFPKATQHTRSSAAQGRGACPERSCWMGLRRRTGKRKRSKKSEFHTRSALSSYK